MKAFPKDVEVKTMTKRHIGVESELGINPINVGTITKKCSKRGLLQSVGYDGGGREFRTNPIAVHTLKQVRGFNYLIEYCGALKGSTVVIKSGGTHIHISILNSDHENMESNATAMAIAFYRQFQKISGRETHWANRHTLTTLQQVRTLLAERKFENDGGARTYNLKGSMLAPTQHQTLEFRGPKGSNDYKEILAWIEFLNNVAGICNRKSVQGVAFKELLKGDWVSSYAGTLKGWRKLSKRELEQKFDGYNLREVV